MLGISVTSMFGHRIALENVQIHYHINNVFRQIRGTYSHTNVRKNGLHGLTLTLASDESMKRNGRHGRCVFDWRKTTAVTSARDEHVLGCFRKVHSHRRKTPQSIARRGSLGVCMFRRDIFKSMNWSSQLQAKVLKWVVDYRRCVQHAAEIDHTRVATMCAN